MLWFKFLRSTLPGRPKGNMSDTGTVYEEEQETLMEHPIMKISRASQRQRHLWISLILINTLMLLTSIFVLASKWQQTSQMNYKLKQTSFYSPLLDRVEIPLSPRRINGSLFPQPNTTHPQLPSPEVENYWFSFELTHPFPITKAELLSLGRDPRTTVRFHDSLNLGPESYLAALDTIHVIHCLNSLRKQAFRDYPAFPTKPDIHHPELKWLHLAHCTDILLQNLLCMPNTDLITYNWVETQHHPVPDFSIHHQCWDFDTMFEWVKENSVPTEQWWDMPKTDDVDWIPQEAGYFEVFGHQNQHQG